jgi:hypothetical protein
MDTDRYDRVFPPKPCRHVRRARPVLLSSLTDNPCAAYSFVRKKCSCSKLLVVMGHLHSKVPTGQQVSSPGIEPGPRPSQGRMRIRHNPRTYFSKYPAEESNLVRQIRSLSCCPSHPQGVRLFRSVARPGIEPGPTASEARAPPRSGGRRSGTLTGQIIPQYPDLELNQDQDLRSVLCDPLHHRDRFLIKSRRLELHQHEPVYKTGASLFGHIGNQHECKDSNPV